jgi:hypothetical protein
MTPSFPVVLVLVAAASASAQRNPWFFQPLAQVREFLQLSDSQLQTILTNNGEYNRWAFEKQTRIQQVQTEIVHETAKENLDPVALGVRYAEVETTCREMKLQAATYQKKNADVLTDAQKAKMKILEEAMKLAPVIGESQGGNLMGGFAYAPLFFTSTSGGVGGSLIGGVIPTANGCYSPGLTAVIRTGDFSSEAVSASEPGRSARRSPLP